VRLRARCRVAHLWLCCYLFLRARSMRRLLFRPRLSTWLRNSTFRAASAVFAVFRGGGWGGDGHASCRACVVWGGDGHASCIGVVYRS
jgi:hypothetical protein